MEQALLDELCAIRKILAMLVGCCRQSPMSEDGLRREFEQWEVRKTNVSTSTAVQIAAHEDPSRVLIIFSFNLGAGTISITPSGMGGIDGVIVLSNIGDVYEVSYEKHYGLSQSQWLVFASGVLSLGVTEVFRNRIASPAPGTT